MEIDATVHLLGHLVYIGFSVVNGSGLNLISCGFTRKKKQAKSRIVLFFFLLPVRYRTLAGGWEHGYACI